MFRRSCEDFAASCRNVERRMVEEESAWQTEARKLQAMKDATKGERTD